MTGFWNSDTYKIVKAMKATGNRPGIVAQWKSTVERWAISAVNDPDAVAVRAWLPLWQVRPFYTAAELAPMWPALAIALGLQTRMMEAPSPRKLEFELHYAELPSFPFEGQCYFIVERIHHWRQQDYSEIKKEFDRA
jgi:hypothetical protein